MGTRSTMKFISKYNNKLTPLINVYQQYDGYIDGVGHQLAEWLLDKKIVNGIPFGVNTLNMANGFGCLIAQYIKEFKNDVGNFYVTEMENSQEYNYEVIFDEDKYFSSDYNDINDLITIKVDSFPNFTGTPSELLNFEESEEEE